MKMIVNDFATSNNDDRRVEKESLAVDLNLNQSQLKGKRIER